MAQESTQVTNNPEQRRYETTVEGHLAQAQYREQDGTITFTHTEVPTELEGRGIGSALARTALDDARDRNLEVVPLCPFIASYIQRHSEYLDLVAPSHRAQLESNA